MTTEKSKIEKIYKSGDVINYIFTRVIKNKKGEWRI